MKKVLFLLQAFFLTFFVATLCLSVFEITGAPGFLSKYNYTEPKYDSKEHFDPALRRIESVKEMVSYCDSVYNAHPDKMNQDYSALYTQVVRRTVRSRFYHGYSTYGFGNNYMALIGDRLYSQKEANIAAIVIPDEILKYPFAACSQQCIILMEVLGQKGFSTRPVGFAGNSKTGGHFCLEVYFNGGWHFFDPDMEPDYKVFEAYGYPDVKTLVANKDMVKQAYHKGDPEKIAGIFFGPHNYGAIDKFPAPNARIYQYATMVLSYTLWLVFGAAFIFVRRKYLALSNKHVWRSWFFIPFIHRNKSAGNYPDYSASGA